MQDESAPDTTLRETGTGGEPQNRCLTPAAERALAEAAERRAAIEEAARSLPRELGGRGGTEPVRYGDWEIKGIACDF